MPRDEDKKDDPAGALLADDTAAEPLEAEVVQNLPAETTEIPHEITVEVGATAQKTLENFTETVRYWAKRGAATKVRVKYDGKKMLPDIPVAYVVAAEAPVAEVMEGELDGLLLDGAGDDALVEGAAEHLREERDDVDAHVP